MGLHSIIQRSLVYHWRMHVAVVLAVIAGSAALTGALIVGDSMRESLRDLALNRLGPIDIVATGPRFFTENMVESISKEETGQHAPMTAAVPVIALQSGIVNANSHTRVNKMSLWGVDGRFSSLDPAWPHVNDIATISGRSIILNRVLASDLDVKVGDDVLLRLEKRSHVPTETLLGRPEDIRASLRLTVSGIISDQGVGELSLQPNQYTPRNAFVQLSVLQRTLEKPGRINTILASAHHMRVNDPAEWIVALLEPAWREVASLEDYDLSLRVDEEHGYFALETERMLIEPHVEAVATRLAGQDQVAQPIIAYLANTIALVGLDGNDTKEIPYSIVAGLDPVERSEKARTSQPTTANLSSELVGGVGRPSPGAIWLNEWGANDLGAKVGDKIALHYDVARTGGGLDQKRTVFELERIVPIEGWADDPGLTPPYKGITEADSIADWDPPESLNFDTKRIRPQDEEYWREHKATPKAFVSLETGRKLWGESGDRFGQYTAIFFYPTNGESLEKTAQDLRKMLPTQLEATRLGFTFRPVKYDALAASKGSTDFGELFLAFSFFVIIAAAMLVALVFRLGVERRAKEVGILLALGFRKKRVARLFLTEGLYLAITGSALGLLAAIGYAALMLTGLRTWWSGAVNAPFLALHVNVLSLVYGLLAGIFVSFLSIAWSMRGLMRISPRALLAGGIAALLSVVKRKRPWLALSIIVIAILGGLVGLIAPLISPNVSPVPAFFGSGAALLIAGIAGLSTILRAKRIDIIHARGSSSQWMLSLRNMTRSRGRSLLTTSLIASAVFVIVAVGAFRHDAAESTTDKNSGSGGFNLMAESVVPIPINIAEQPNNNIVALSDGTQRGIRESTIIPIRTQGGGDASCLNLYRIDQPRILAVPPKMIDQGSFVFSKTIEPTEEEKMNPWLLLNRKFGDGSVPAIGDANSLTYLLKVGLGEDLVVKDDRGRDRKLRIVGMLSGSIFQGELLVAESNFLKLFPSNSGYRMMLISSAEEKTKLLQAALENDLGDYGLDVETTQSRLDNYFAVENSYISTFQALGGLGLILGTFGLGAVMLRNVLERRSELALLRAVGWRRAALGWLVIVENIMLLVAGLVIGCVAAIVAIVPSLREGSPIDWSTLGLTLLIVLVVGILAGLAAVASTLRMPLIASLRSE